MAMEMVGEALPRVRFPSAEPVPPQVPGRLSRSLVLRVLYQLERFGFHPVLPSSEDAEADTDTPMVLELPRYSSSGTPSMLFHSNTGQWNTEVTRSLIVSDSGSFDFFNGNGTGSFDRMGFMGGFVGSIDYLTRFGGFGALFQRQGRGERAFMSNSLLDVESLRPLVDLQPQSGEGHALPNSLMLTQALFVVTVEVGTGSLVLMLSNQDNLSHNAKILLNFAGACCVTGFVSGLGGTLTPGAGLAKRIMTGIAGIAAPYGFLAMMGTLLPENLMLKLTGSACAALLPALAYLFIK